MEGHAPRGTTGRKGHRWAIVVAVLAVLAACAGVAWAWAAHRTDTGSGANASGTATAQSPTTGAATDAPADDTADPVPADAGQDTADPTPSPTGDGDTMERARQLVASWDLDRQAAQLVMVPLAFGTDPADLAQLIGTEHVGSVILMGNWTTGTDGVLGSVRQVQGYADGDALLVATDQEGGLVQHLQGAGFEAMPSAVEQGSMTLPALRQQAAAWGGELNAAGVNVDLAPSVDTVTIDRASNAPIGALDRDFGLDAAGNAAHAIAFVQGLRDAGVGASPKHYPGLGAVTGNTDFTADGIVDSSTTRDGAAVQAFDQVIAQAQPAMVMVSLASYELIDPGVPAAFSPVIVDGMLRTDAGYGGVVISDSLSASAVSGYDPTQLGVMLLEAGGDLACVDDPSYTMPILQGIRERAAADEDFARLVTESAVRVVALKMELGLL